MCVYTDSGRLRPVNYNDSEGRRMEVKVRASANGAYADVIQPPAERDGKIEGEPTVVSSTAIAPGEELTLKVPGATDPSQIEVGDVVATPEQPAAEEGGSDQGGEEQPAEGGGTPEPEPEAPAAEEPQQDNGMPAGLAIGRVVIYRSKTGKYDLPAIVNATQATLDPEGVQLGHVPELSTPDAVHLTVFTCGKEGTSREGNVVNNEAAGGSYQEFNIPMSGFSPATATEGDEPQPGTWRFPERV